MTWIDEVDGFRRQLPAAKKRGGAPNPDALRNLLDEFIEFAQSGFNDKSELADIVYYAAGCVIAGKLTEKKARSYVAQACALVPLGITFELAMVSFRAKYAYRAKGMKNHSIERELILNAVLETGL